MVQVDASGREVATLEEDGIGFHVSREGGLHDRPQPLTSAYDLVIETEQEAVAGLVEHLTGHQAQGPTVKPSRHPDQAALSQVATERVRAGHGEPATALAERRGHPGEELRETGGDLHLGKEGEHGAADLQSALEDAE